MAFDYRREYQRYRQYYLNIKRIYQRPVTRVSLFVLLSFTLVVFFSLFAIKPTVATIGKLVRDIEDKKQIHQDLSNKAKALDELQSKLVTVDAEIPLIYDSLPQKTEVGRLTQELEYVGEALNVQILSIKFGGYDVGQKSKQTFKPEQLTLSLTAGGKFDELKQFIETVEHLDRVLVFDTVSLTSASNAYRKLGIDIIAEVSGKTTYLNYSPEGVNESQ